MARPKSTESATNKATTDKAVVADLNKAEENKNMSVKETKIESLKDTDEIQVISIVPNVSYFDKHTGDTYVWENSDDVEFMKYSVIKDMWRNHKGYFKSMLLRPKDDRVINELGLTKLYSQLDFLMDDSNYTKSNIDDIFNILKSVSNETKFTVCNKVKNSVANGSISDISVIRRFENEFGLDLISLL